MLFWKRKTYNKMQQLLRQTPMPQIPTANQPYYCPEHTKIKDKLSRIEAENIIILLLLAVILTRLI